MVSPAGFIGRRKCCSPHFPDQGSDVHGTYETKNEKKSKRIIMKLYDETIEDGPSVVPGTYRFMGTNY
jgi:hypothetical protein